MHSKLFKITLEPKLYPKSVSRRGLVNPLSPTFPNINLTQAIAKLLAVWKITQKWLQNLYFYRYNFNISYKSFFYLTSLSRRDPANPSTPTFYKIHLTETMLNLLAAWKFNQKQLQ